MNAQSDNVAQLGFLAEENILLGKDDPQFFCSIVLDICCDDIELMSNLIIEGNNLIDTLGNDMSSHELRIIINNLNERLSQHIHKMTAIKNQAMMSS